jgi:hypothetical protein
MTDYTELPLYLDEDETVNLWIVFKDRTEVSLHNVTSAVRSEGWWSITHEWVNREVTTLVEDARIQHFRVVPETASNVNQRDNFADEPAVSGDPDD